jgi:transposase-like protein
LADTEPQSKVRESVKEKKVQKRYDEEFKRQAVELVIHSGKTQAQIAREQSDTMEEGLPGACEAGAA